MSTRLHTQSQATLYYNDNILSKVCLINDMTQSNVLTRFTIYMYNTFVEPVQMVVNTV